MPTTTPLLDGLRFLLYSVNCDVLPADSRHPALDACTVRFFFGPGTNNGKPVDIQVKEFGGGSRTFMQQDGNPADAPMNMTVRLFVPIDNVQEVNVPYGLFQVSPWSIIEHDAGLETRLMYIGDVRRAIETLVPLALYIDLARRVGQCPCLNRV